MTKIFNTLGNTFGYYEGTGDLTVGTHVYRYDGSGDIADGTYDVRINSPIRLFRITLVNSEVTVSKVIWVYGDVNNQNVILYCLQEDGIQAGTTLGCLQPADLTYHPVVPSGTYILKGMYGAPTNDYERVTVTSPTIDVSTKVERINTTYYKVYGEDIEVGSQIFNKDGSAVTSGTIILSISGSFTVITITDSYVSDVEENLTYKQAMNSSNQIIGFLYSDPIELGGRVLDSSTGEQLSDDEYIGYNIGYNFTASNGIIVELSEQDLTNNYIKFNYLEYPTTILSDEYFFKQYIDSSLTEIDGVGTPQTETVNEFWREMTCNFPGSEVGVFRIKVDETGAPILEGKDCIIEYISGISVDNVISEKSLLIIYLGKSEFTISDFVSRTENTSYTDDTLIWSYTNVTTTETIEVYPSYDVKTYVKIFMGPGLPSFSSDTNLSSIEFNITQSYKENKNPGIVQLTEISNTCSGCSNLEEVSISDNITSVSDSFNDLSSLTSFTSFALVPPTITSSFDNLPETAILYVQKGYVEDYMNSDWSIFFHTILTIPEPPVPPTPFRGYGFNRTNMIDIDYLNEVFIRRN